MASGQEPFALARQQLKRIGGKSPLRDFLDYLAVRDVSLEVFDFNIKALDTTNVWTVGAGATATTWAVRAEAGGWIRGVTGTTAATSGLQLSIPQKYWTGTSKAGMAILYRLSSVSEIRFEAGFVDALPSVNTTVVNNMSTPTFNTTASAALWMFDHTGSTTTSGLYTDGSGVGAQKAATTTNRPAAATSHFVAIQTDGQTAMMWAGDSPQPVASLTSALTAADGLIPVVSVKKSDTNSANVDIDAIILWSERV